MLYYYSILRSHKCPNKIKAFILELFRTTFTGTQTQPTFEMTPGFKPFSK